MRYIDPSGEEVHSNNLTVDEQQQLINDWKKKTGFLSIYFDKNNKLVIDASKGFEGGSSQARQQLSDAVNSKDKVFDLLSSNSDSGTLFAETKSTALSRSAETGQKTQTFTVKIDFDDFKNISGDQSAIDAFSIGLVVQHEFNHNLYGPYGDTPNSADNPGPIENCTINPIRRQLNLPERVNYVSEPIPAARKAFFPKGGSQIRFRLNGKEKFLRWRDDKVGKAKN